MRPLTFNSLTSGSRIVVPAYPALTLAVGLLFIVQDDHRTQGPAFAAARTLMSIRVWGALFIAISVVKIAGLITQRRDLFIVGLVCGAGLCCFWACLIEVTAVRSVNVSYTSGLWAFFVVVAHLATASSLARDRVGT